MMQYNWIGGLVGAGCSVLATYADFS